MWSPRHQKVSRDTGNCPYHPFCLCLTHCRRGAGYLGTRLDPEQCAARAIVGRSPQGTAPLALPLPAFLFPGAAPCCPAHPAMEGKGYMGAGQGPCRSDQNPAYAFQAKKEPHGSPELLQGQTWGPSAPALHFVPVSKLFARSAYFVANWFLHMEENRAD